MIFKLLPSDEQGILRAGSLERAIEVMYKVSVILDTTTCLAAAQITQGYQYKLKWFVLCAAVDKFLMR